MAEMMEAQSKQELHLLLEGELPGLNEMTAANRRNRYAGAKQKSEVEEALVLQIRQQRGGKPLFTRRHHWRFTWHCKDRRRDPDNIEAGVKFVFDALQAAGTIVNDGWGLVASLHHEFDNNAPFGVTVEAFVEEQ